MYNNIDIPSLVRNLSAYNAFMDIGGAKHMFRMLPVPTMLQNEISDVAHSLASLLSKLPMVSLSDNDVPKIYSLYDITMSMLECLSPSQFVSRFSDKKLVSKVTKQNATIRLLKDSGFDSTPTEISINMVRYYKDCSFLPDFFDKLVAIASIMVQLSGLPNKYNDYCLSRGYKGRYDLLFSEKRYSNNGF